MLYGGDGGVVFAGRVTYMFVLYQAAVWFG